MKTRVVNIDIQTNPATQKLKRKEKLVFQKDQLKIQDCTNYQQPKTELEANLIAIENCKQLIIDTDHLQKKEMMELINVHMKLRELDHIIYNVYQNFTQATALVNFEITKLSYYLKAFKSSQQSDTSAHLKHLLEEGLKHLKQARSHQEKAFSNYYENKKIDNLKTEFSDLIECLDSDINIMLNDVLGTENHIYANYRIATFSDEFDQANHAILNNNKEQIKAMEVEIKKVKINKLMTNSSVKQFDHSSDLTKARNLHGTFKQPIKSSTPVQTRREKGHNKLRKTA